MASQLVAMGADPSYISNHLEEKSIEAMHCYELVAKTVHSYADGKIVIAYMDQDAWRSMERIPTITLHPALHPRLRDRRTL